MESAIFSWEHPAPALLDLPTGCPCARANSQRIFIPRPARLAFCVCRGLALARPSALFNLRVPQARFLDGEPRLDFVGLDHLLFRFSSSPPGSRAGLCLLPGNAHLSLRTGEDFFGQLYQLGTIRAGANGRSCSIFGGRRLVLGNSKKLLPNLNNPNNRRTFLHSQPQTAVAWRNSDSAVRSTNAKSGDAHGEERPDPGKEGGQCVCAPRARKVVGM